MEEVYIKEEPVEMIHIDEVPIKQEEEEEDVNNIKIKNEPVIIKEECNTIEITPDLPDFGSPNVASDSCRVGKARGNKELQWIEERGRIISLHLAGNKSSAIAKELKVSLTTVKKWVRRYYEEGTLEAHRRNGRPKVLSEGQRESVVLAARLNPHKTAVDVKTDLNLDVSVYTIRRALKDEGLLCCGTEINEPLTAAEKEERLDFVKQYKSKTEAFWQDVVYIDDKVFVISANGQLKIMRERGSRFASYNVAHERQRGRIAIAYIGFMLGHGVGELVKIDERMTDDMYVEILEDVVVPAVRMWALPEPNTIHVVHDNPAVHQTNAVQDFFRANPLIQPINYPSNSSDLNPIENLWDLIVSEWDGSNIRTEENLHKHVMSVWEAIRQRPGVCQNFASLMTRRLQDVEAAVGGYTNY